MPNQDSAAGTDANDLDLIARAVGLVVLQWGQAEQSLELLVASLWQSLGGKRLAKKIPVMLTPKLNFVRSCAAEIPELNPLQPTLVALTHQFERLSALRHDLVHGAPASIPTVDGHFVFSRLHVHDGYHYASEVRVPVAAYPSLVRELVDLGRAAHDAAHSVFELSKDLNLTPTRPESDT